MSIKCILLDEHNNLIDYADLSFLGGGVTFLVPLAEKTLSQFEVGDKVVFQVEDKFSQIFDADISEVSYGKLHLQEVRNLAPLLHRDVRVEVDIKSTVFFTVKGKDQPVGVQLRDLSSGGMCFTCKEKLSPNYEYEFLTNWIEAPFLVRFRILRWEEANYNEFSYGCEFVGLARTEECLIRSSVFKIQVENYRQRRMDEDDAV